MAVAVKNSPEARTTSSPFDRMQIAALGGLIYTLGSLAIIFKVIPMIWAGFWGGLGFQVDSFASYTLQGLLMLAGTAGLIVVGGRLLGPKTQPGTRAGIFTAFVGLLLVVMLTRWYSIWAEHIAFYPEVVPGLGKTGIQGVGDFFFFLLSLVLFLPPYYMGWTGAMGMTILVGVVLLGVFLRMFFSKRAESFLIGFEEQGWFSGTAYKKNQGLKVRRGTILGILLLFGSGVWTLVSHNTLAATSDWNLDLPFTGVQTFRVDDLALRSIGLPLREDLKKEHPDWFAAEKPARDELIPALNQLETGLKEARKKDKTILDLTTDIRRAREHLEDGYFLEGSKESLALVNDLNGQLRNLKDANGDTEWFKGLSSAVETVKKTAEATKTAADKPIKLSRYVIQTLGQKIDPAAHVMLYDPIGANSEVKNHEVVTKEKFAQIEKEAKEKGNAVPETLEPRPITGPVTYASITLLPSVKFTLPLLLLALTLWFAWRVVNLPVFSDFLIATEGELNKVSWTTRRRLFQDTIVVLVTLLLMAFYLFAMDQIWLHVLSWRPVGVIVFPQENPQQINKGADKPW
jgi:preprotein translocase SecE subunit